MSDWVVLDVAIISKGLFRWFPIAFAKSADHVVFAVCTGIGLIQVWVMLLSFSQTLQLLMTVVGKDGIGDTCLLAR